MVGVIVKLNDDTPPGSREVTYLSAPITDSFADSCGSQLHSARGLMSIGALQANFRLALPLSFQDDMSLHPEIGLDSRMACVIPVGHSCTAHMVRCRSELCRSRLGCVVGKLNSDSISQHRRDPLGAYLCTQRSDWSHR